MSDGALVLLTAPDPSADAGARAAYRRITSTRRAVLAAGVLALLGSVLVDLGTGPGGFPLREVLETVLEPTRHGPKLALVVWDLRLPVALMAALIGAMLGIAGAHMQTALDNPLAEPFTLGISAAASFGAAIAIVLGLGVLPGVGTYLVTANAFVAALAASALLFTVARWQGARPETLILVGIALMFTFNALLALMEYNASETKLQQIVFWMMGSLQRASWTKIAICLAVLSTAVVWSMLRSWPLTALKLGDARAASFGVAVDRLRMETLLVVSVLAATAVSFVGTVGFIGLVGPHVARMLVGEEQRFFLPLGALFGALILSLTSIVSKTITPGIIYPVGIITALIGVPFFMSLVLGQHRRAP